MVLPIKRLVSQPGQRFKDRHASPQMSSQSSGIANPVDLCTLREEGKLSNTIPHEDGISVPGLGESLYTKPQPHRCCLFSGLR